MSTAPNFALDLYPIMPVSRLWSSIAWKIVVDMLVFGGKRAVVAIFAQRDVDNQVPLFHERIFPTSRKASSIRSRTLRAL
jgi:hypothetical protein